MATRRQFLAGSLATSASLSFWPGWALAQDGADARFLFVLLRGGLDGLHAVAPCGDPAYEGLRGAAALSPHADRAAHVLDGVFALHPALGFSSELYGRNQFLPVVATAPPYWGRSHFQAQDCVENGTPLPDGAKTGWLNRCAENLPGVDALACAIVMPLAMRGNAKVTTWSPPLSVEVNPSVLQRLQPLYAADRTLEEPFAHAVEQSRKLDSAMAGGNGGQDSGGDFQVMMRAAGAMMRAPDGPRVAFIGDEGWDTHARQQIVLAQKLAELDSGLRAFHETIGTAWARTVVVIATEFGRTARINGDGGTDHGTGGMTLLAGGAVNGGRVAGQWPGIARTALFEGRDLRATTDLRSVFKGVLSEHLGMDMAMLESRVFPDSADAAPMTGLVKPDSGVGA